MSLREQFKDLKDEFLKITKRILKDNISKVPETLQTFEIDIIRAYNNISELLDAQFSNLVAEEQQFFRSEIIYIREKIVLCFGKLNLPYTLPSDLFEPLIESSLGDVTIIDEEEFQDSNSSSNSSVGDLAGFTLRKPASTDIDQVQVRETIDITEPEINVNVNNSQNEKMAHKDSREYLRFASAQISRTYAGDPIQLKSFLNAIDVVKAATDAAEMPLLKKFLTSRLEGKALDSVDTTKTLDEMLHSLEEVLKPDSSEVIEGKLIALRLNRANIKEFGKQVEKLAEALQRSLVVVLYCIL